MGNENIKQTNNDFKRTKKGLLDSLNTQLGNIMVTKQELEKYKEGLKQKGVTDPVKIANYVKEYPINKKLQFVLHEASLHEQLDIAIEFLDKTIKEIEAKENGKETQ